ncbi:MAG: NADP oxidoreductase [Paracoccus denitrificans]|nr:MAG: NADP oxidoreductase [Paracoccus denitrificans]PZO86368.1 MAG: NADP oxidoreductase [Paracoccus denitrificans]
MKIGIIGATGWLGAALGKGLLTRAGIPGHDLVLLNRGGPSADYHGQTNVVWARDADDLVAQSDVIVVSVRPEDWAGLRLNASGRLVLSFMAGVDAATLAACGGRIVRVMPNAAAEIGASYSPFWAAKDVTQADRMRVRLIAEAIGTTDELPSEDQIDLMTALPGSGAAYPALMAVAMVDFMRGQGVTEAVAWRAAEAAVIGGARLLDGQFTQAAQMVATYRDYRGTTAAGIDAAEAAGFSHAIDAALRAATDKARKMARELGDQQE